MKGWNDSDMLPEHILARFRSWQQSGVALEKIQIPRWTATRETQDAEPELHVFSDASAKAYGVAAYRRMATKDGTECSTGFFESARRSHQSRERGSSRINPSSGVASGALGGANARFYPARVGRV